MALNILNMVHSIENKRISKKIVCIYWKQPVKKTTERNLWKGLNGKRDNFFLSVFSCFPASLTLLIPASLSLSHTIPASLLLLYLLLFRRKRLHQFPMVMNGNRMTYKAKRRDNEMHSITLCEMSQLKDGISIDLACHYVCNWNLNKSNERFTLFNAKSSPTKFKCTQKEE